MSNPGAIVVRPCPESNKEDVWLYSHHEGDKTLNVVRAALTQGRRWGNAHYLTRIIFEVLIAGERGGEANFGIGVRAMSSDHPIVVVDTTAQCVFTVEPDELTEDAKLLDKPEVLRTWTFNQCVEEHDKLN